MARIYNNRNMRDDMKRVANWSKFDLCHIQLIIWLVRMES